MSLPAIEFVESVRVALKAKNGNDLADKLGLGAAGGQRVQRWLKGENEPDYEATMLMLEKTGWLRMGTMARHPPDPLEVLASSVAALTLGQASILAGLQKAGLVAEPANTPEKPAARPKRKRR